MNQLLNEYRLTYTGTTEQSRLTTFGVRSEKVDNLDTGLVDHLSRRLLGERRRATDNRVASLRFDLLTAVDHFTQYVEHPTQCFRSDRYGNGSAGVRHRHSPTQSVGGSHCETSNPVVSEFHHHF